MIGILFSIFWILNWFSIEYPFCILLSMSLCLCHPFMLFLKCWHSLQVMQISCFLDNIYPKLFKNANIMRKDQQTNKQTGEGKNIVNCLEFWFCSNLLSFSKILQTKWLHMYILHYLHTCIHVFSHVRSYALPVCKTSFDPYSQGMRGCQLTVRLTVGSMKSYQDKLD